MSSAVMNSALRSACAQSKAASSPRGTSGQGLKFAPSLALKLRGPARISAGRRAQVVSVSASDSTKGGLVNAAENMGFDLSEGMFGFTPFSELWVGRFAMTGFAVGLGNEFASGRGILMQLGLCDGNPNYPLFALLAMAMGGATLAASTKTLVDVQKGDMTVKQLKRYAQFFGIDEKAVEDASKRLKKLGDFTSPDNFEDIAAARARMPADAVLGMEGEERASTSAAIAMKAEEGPLGALSAAQIDEVAAELKAVGATSAMDPPQGVWLKQTDGLTGIDELAYAKEVEMRNGRWAMIGFATAILIEAGTGMGILPQLIFYFKAIGLLGPESGF